MINAGLVKQFFGRHLFYAPLGLGFGVRVRSVISVSFRVRVMVSADIWRMVWQEYMVKFSKGYKIDIAPIFLGSGMK